MVKAIIFDWIGTLYERNNGLFPYSVKVLTELKPRYKLGLVTYAKKSIDERKRELEESGIKHYFDSIIIDTAKSQEHYIRCMKEMKATPETTIIVDDRMIRGIKLGNQLGCKTYWIQNGEYANELPNKDTGEPTKTINSIEDLLKLL